MIYIILNVIWCLILTSNISVNYSKSTKIIIIINYRYHYFFWRGGGEGGGGVVHKSICK